MKSIIKTVSGRMFLLTSIICLTVMVETGCRQEEPDDSQAYYTNGEGEIGINGGRIFLNDELSPLNHAYIQVYPHELTEPVYFTMSQPDSNYYVNGSNNHLMLEIRPAGLEFRYGDYLGIPYAGDLHTYKSVAYLFHPDNGILEEQMKVSENDFYHLIDVITYRTGIYFVDEEKMRMGLNLVTIHVNGVQRLAVYLCIGADFSEIPTRQAFDSEGFPDARSILNSDYMEGTASNFKAYLYRENDPALLSYKEMEVRIIQGLAGEDSVQVVIDSISKSVHHPVFTTQLQKDQAVDEWMTGFPLLFIFNDYIPLLSPNNEYYLKVLWALEKEHSSFTDRYYLQEWPEMMITLPEAAGDRNVNGILDTYEGVELGQPCPGLPSFEYQGKTYNTVQIGDQCWMKENLNYETGNSWCYDGIEADCEHYGRLYDWETVMNGAESSNEVPSGVRGICPPGWHVPSDEEWQILEGTVDSRHWVGDPIWSQTGLNGYDAGKMLKATFGWEHNIGTDTYGFSAMPGGTRDYGGYYYWGGSTGLWWTSRKESESNAWAHLLVDDYATVDRTYLDQRNGLSLRCLKD